jgi:predicted lactoylglutathione lyase
MPDINGIAHMQLCVSDMEVSVPFYSQLLQAMGMTPVLTDQNYFYCVGAKTGLAIAPTTEGNEDSRFAQGAVGLHHICFRARSRADVNEMHGIARRLGAKIIREPQEDGFAPGYYSTLFEDPDGIRLEVNYVPGKGLLGD